MTSVNTTGFVEPDAEIEWTIHRSFRAVIEGSISGNVDIKEKESSTIAEQQRTLSDYKRLQFIGEEFSVQAQTVNANNFDLARLIGMIRNTE